MHNVLTPTKLIVGTIAGDSNDELKRDYENLIFHKEKNENIP